MHVCHRSTVIEPFFFFNFYLTRIHIIIGVFSSLTSQGLAECRQLGSILFGQERQAELDQVKYHGQFERVLAARLLVLVDELVQANEVVEAHDDDLVVVGEHFGWAVGAQEPIEERLPVEERGVLATQIADFHTRIDALDFGQFFSRNFKKK